MNTIFWATETHYKSSSVFSSTSRIALDEINVSPYMYFTVFIVGLKSVDTIITIERQILIKALLLFAVRPFLNQRQLKLQLLCWEGILLGGKYQVFTDCALYIL